MSVRSQRQLRYFNRAVLDFGEVVRSTVDSKVDWNMIGLCRGQLGEPEASEEAYNRAITIADSFKARRRIAIMIVYFLYCKVEAC